MTTDMYINLILIKPNSFKFVRENHYNNLDKLATDMELYIENKNIKFDDMMDTIITTLGLTPELIGDTTIISETTTNIYQLCFIGEPPENMIETANTTETPNTVTDNLNMIGYYLTGEKLNGYCILLNSKINDKNTCLPDSVTYDELVKILHSKFVHKGIFVSEDEKNQLVEFDYFDHPIEYYNIHQQEDYEQYDIKNITFLEFELCLVIKKDADVVNKRMTRLVGDQVIIGDVLIISKSTHEYYDITYDILDKLLVAAYGPLQNRTLNNDEMSDEKQVDGLPIVMNKYMILEKRYKQFKNNCANCKNDLSDTQLICSGCYRVKYDSEQCRLSNWKFHKIECLYNKKK